MKKVLLLTIGMFLISANCLQAQQNESLHKIKKKEGWGYVDNKGKEIIPCEYLVLGDLGEEDVPIRAQKTRKQWIYVDGNGKEITGNDSYEYAYPFYDSDLALVGSEGRFGYINKQGRLRIPLQYKKAYPFSEELAAVKKVNNRKFGFINTGDNEVIEPIYTDVKWGFVGGFAWVKRGNKWGVINKWGTTIIGFDYMQLSYFDPNTGAADAVTKNGVTHYYLKGKKYSSKRERDEALKPIILWPEIPEKTKEQLFVFNAEIKSDSEIDYCKMILNGEELPEEKDHCGVAIAEDTKQNSSYTIKINRSIALREGVNTIKLMVQNLRGGTIEERQIEFRPIQENAFIVWNHFPTVTNDPNVELDVTIKSTFKNLTFQVFQQENEIEIPLSKGSPDLGDNEFDDFRYPFRVKRMLTLEEGNDTIRIVIKNTKGKTITSDQKVIKYTPKEKRVALVIGNENYNRMPLNQPVNDAEAMASRLDELGFTVTYKHDLEYSEMKTIADRFVLDSRGCEVALFYFSGHGEQVSATSYLLPVDFDFEKDYCEDKGFPTTYVLKSEAEVKIVIIDACRTMITKGTIEDLSKMNQSNVFFAYSSAPNQPSYQGSGKYSIYTEALLKWLEKEGLTIEKLFKLVGADVEDTVDNKKLKPRQVPYTEGSLRKDFIFNKQH